MTFDAKNGAAVKSLAAKLVQAERLGTMLPLAEIAGAGLVPATIDAGAAAQAAAVAAMSGEFSCWKVAINPERIPVAAPILDLSVAANGERAAISRPGAKGLEFELCVRLADDILPPDARPPLKRDDLLARIAAIHFGVELLSFRIVEENKVPFPLFLADRLGNHSFVLGPEIERAEFERIAAQDGSAPDVTIRINDDIQFSGRLKHPLGDPLAPLLAYANNPCDRLGGLRRGQVVTTGSLCGVISLARKADITIDGKPPLPMRIAISPF